MLGKSAFGRGTALLTNLAAASRNSLKVGRIPCSREMSGASLAANENAIYSRTPNSCDRITWLDGSQSSSPRFVAFVVTWACTNRPYLTRQVWAAFRTTTKAMTFKTKEEDRVRASPLDRESLRWPRKE